MTFSLQRPANKRAEEEKKILQGRAVSLEELLKLRFHALSIPLFNSKQVAASQTGGYTSAIRGRGVDFAEVRTYQTGDDIRHIDWRVTARTGRPHTKLFREERERPVFFIVDYSASMFFGTRVSYKSVVAAKAASLLAFAAINQNNKVGGIVFSGARCQSLQAREGHYGVLPLLNLLANTPKPPLLQQKSGDLAKSLLQVRHLARTGCLIVFLSDFMMMDDAAKTLLYEFSTRYDMVAGFISDPLEAEPPPPNYYWVTNGSQRLAIDSYNVEWRNKYSQQFLERKKNIHDICIHQQVPLLELRTNDDLIKTTTNFFKAL